MRTGSMLSESLRLRRGPQNLALKVASGSALAARSSAWAAMPCRDAEGEIAPWHIGALDRARRAERSAVHGAVRIRCKRIACSGKLAVPICCDTAGRSWMGKLHDFEAASASPIHCAQVSVGSEGQDGR